jgi:uncharacterized damage-inducible protein DinB
MTRTDEITELYRFNSWAQTRMFDATSQLTPDEFTRDLKNSFPSVRDTLLHAVGAEWVWLTRWHGTSPTSFPYSDQNLDNEGIRQVWQQIDQERAAFLASLDEPGIDRVVEYTSFAGKHFAFPLWQMLRHVVNHATYHRGQITTMLRQLGHNAVSTDLILLYQEEQRAASV